MKTITEELRQEIAQAGDEPLRLVDPVSGKEYVLIEADVYARIHRILSNEDAQFEPREAYSSILSAWDQDDENPEQYLEYLPDQ